jgi:hypothetical protein
MGKSKTIAMSEEIKTKHTPEEILSKNVGKLAVSGLKWKSLDDRKKLIIQAMEEYSTQQKADLLEALKDSVEEIKFLLKEVKEVKPGSYRADTTIRNAENIIKKSES